MTPSIARLLDQYEPKTRKPTPMSYRGYDVTGVVPESASLHDLAFIEWSGRADEKIAVALERGWGPDEIGQMLKEVVKYPTAEQIALMTR